MIMHVKDRLMPLFCRRALATVEVKRIAVSLFQVRVNGLLHHLWAV